MTVILMEKFLKGGRPENKKSEDNITIKLKTVSCENDEHSSCIDAILASFTGA